MTLVLAALLVALTSLPAKEKGPRMRDIADSVDANVITTKFALMLQASDLGTFLSSRGPFTLFVPTDSAFSKLPPGMLDTLLRPENKERLQAIVLFHVVNGKKLTARDLLPLKTVISCQGTPLVLKISHTGTQFVMKGKITHADIKCQNGIINQIDTVLMPPEASLPPLGTAPPPAVKVPATNSPTTTINEEVSPVPGTNAPTASAVNTNAPPVVPVAPAAAH
jgi:uncharacterized surface protein with fasciclin (FAS1) repeats